MSGLGLGLGPWLGQRSAAAALRTNLALYSEQFQNAVWTPYIDATVTANAGTDPLGGSTADRLLLGAGGPWELKQAPGALTGENTFSLYVKRNTGSNQSFRLNSNFGGGNAYSSVFTATASWQRFVWTFTYGGWPDGYISIATDGASASDLLIWGAQLETGAAATAYIGPTLGVPVSA